MGGGTVEGRILTGSLILSHVIRTNLVNVNGFYQSLG